MAPSPPFAWNVESVAFEDDIPARVFLHSVEAVNFHIHAAFEVLLVVRGRIVLYTEGRSRQLEQGDVALVHSWQPHATQELDEGNIILALQMGANAFRHDPSFLHRRFELDDMAENPAGIIQRRVIGRLLAQAYLETLGKRSGWKMEVEAVVLKLVAYLLRDVVHYEDEASNADLAPQDEAALSRILQRVADYIRANATSELSIEDVAKAHRISSGYLSRLFKAETGSSFTAFLTKIRLWRSLRLLGATPEVKVISIAHACGFPNVKSYNLAFRRAFHCSPGEWRKRKASANLGSYPYKDLDMHSAVPVLAAYLNDGQPELYR